ELFFDPAVFGLFGGEQAIAFGDFGLLLIGELVLFCSAGGVTKSGGFVCKSLSVQLNLLAAKLQTALCGSLGLQCGQLGFAVLQLFPEHFDLFFKSRHLCGIILFGGIQFQLLVCDVFTQCLVGLTLGQHFRVKPLDLCIQRSGLPVCYSADGVFGFLFFLGQFFSFQFVFCEGCFGFGNFLFHLASFCSSIDCSLFLSAASIGGVCRVNSSVFSEFLCVIERRLIQILNAAIDDLGQR
ncbi:MAG: hypothetical protein ACK6EB_14160, partial [Planctomyces sp.]